MRRRGAVFVAILAVPGFGAGALCQESDPCLASEVTFETSALERIVREPGRVLEDADSFWEDEPAQRYTSIWAENNGFTISRTKWRTRLESFAALGESDRRGSPLMRITETILDGREDFVARALPHVCSFLPEGTDTGAPVHFTAFIPPRAFVTGGIVINVNAPYWKGDAANILNTLTHEIWHVGYSRLRETRVEPPLRHAQLYGMLDQLQNEGTATYVGYQARAMFPAPDELDYRSLDSADEVTRSLEEVNRLFRRLGTVSEKRLRKLSWKIGVEERAYYVAGAHMARTIDRACGRHELLRTVATGPVSFVTAYNAVVPEDRRIEFPDAETIARRGENSGFSIPVWMIAAAVAVAGLLGFALRRTIRS